ncbi:UDP-glucose dehydrogenase family protein [Bacteroidota bacterium]
MRLSVMGSGYIGLVTGTCFADMGNNVICVDNNKEKLQKLNNNEVPIYEPGLSTLFERNFREKRLHFTDDVKYAVENSDVIFLCLPTPQGEDGSADLSYVLSISEKIGEILTNNDDYKIIVNKSTVPVGTSIKIKEILKSKGVKNFDVVSNPEFLREGFAVEDFMKPDRIVIGSDSKNALKILTELYEPFVRQGNPVFEMDFTSSELTKYAANSYLAMRITYMNELANFCEKVGADVDLVRKGMGSDTRIGNRFLFPGIGYGGSCFPKDVNALIKTSRDNKAKMSILELVDKINKDQRALFVRKILDYFGENLESKLFGVWGLAFKPNTDDMREAPSVFIIKQLLERGAKVCAFDPAASQTAKYYLGDTIYYMGGMYETVKGVDALLILTEWNEFRKPDFSELKNNMKQCIIFDGRNVYEPAKMKELQITYFSIGREPVLFS